MKYHHSKKKHEDNIKAELFLHLRNLGIPCVLEYRHCTPIGQRNCRFDLVVLDAQKENIILIVEVKNGPNTIWPDSKQFARYSKFNVPVWCITDSRAAKRMAEQVKHNLDNNLSFASSFKFGIGSA